MNKIALVEQSFMKEEVTNFNIGDTVRVFVKIAEEGDKTRLQAFEGIVIARKGSGIRQTFTVRRISFGEGVERIFPLHSPWVDRVMVTKRGKVRRAKLYYMRKRIGKEAVRIDQAGELKEEKAAKSENPEKKTKKTEKVEQTEPTTANS
ncbi:MAG: 50S ribosomal protein L19 [Candidatus Omnitrophica bacterium]|nr:50S ribosomal protein L19 [Candidatus Omnitrophota bacterium]